MSDERMATELDRRLGQRIRARRLDLGLSQERLADMLGVTFQQIQKYEKGVNRVAASRLYELAAALNTSVAYFFEGLTGPARNAVAEQDAAFEALSTPEGLQLLTLFNQIEKPRLRRKIVELIRALVEEEAEAAAEAQDKAPP